MSRCVNAGIDNVAFLPEAPQKRLVGASSDSHRTDTRRLDPCLLHAGTGGAGVGKDNAKRRQKCGKLVASM